MTVDPNIVIVAVDHPMLWITRDIADGVMDEHCDVWIDRPVLVHYPEFADSAAQWEPDVAQGQSFEQSHLGSYTVAAVLKWIRVVPHTERECIRVDGARRG